MSTRTNRSSLGLFLDGLAGLAHVAAESFSRVTGGQTDKADQGDRDQGTCIFIALCGRTRSLIPVDPYLDRQVATDIRVA